MPNPAALRLMMPKPAASRLRLFYYTNKLFLQIKFRIDRVKILAVEIILDESERFAESLIMYDLAFSQETDRVEDVRVVAHADDVIIGGAGFCSAAMFSDRSVMASPLEARQSASNGKPAAACGYTPAV